jgi:hypothetical protein
MEVFRFAMMWVRRAPSQVCGQAGLLFDFFPSFFLFLNSSGRVAAASRLEVGKQMMEVVLL